MEDDSGFISVSVCYEEPDFVHIAVTRTEPELQGQTTVGTDIFHCVYWHQFANLGRALSQVYQRLDQFHEEGGLFEISKGRAQGTVETIAFEINPGDMRSSA